MNIMKKLIFVIVIGIGLTTTPSLFADDETATVSEAGVSFSYPKGWTKNIKDVAARTDIWVSNGKGTIFMVQVYKIPVTPAKLSKGYDTSFKKRFAGKLIPAREKKSERTFLGKKTRRQNNRCGKNQDGVFNNRPLHTAIDETEKDMHCPFPKQHTGHKRRKSLCRNRQVTQRSGRRIILI